MTYKNEMLYVVIYGMLYVVIYGMLYVVIYGIVCCHIWGCLCLLRHRMLSYTGGIVPCIFCHSFLNFVTHFFVPLAAYGYASISNDIACCLAYRYASVSG